MPWNVADSRETNTYEYDADGQLIGVQFSNLNQESRFEYDSSGNMIASTTNKKSRNYFQRNQFEYQNGGKFLKHTNNQKFFAEYDRLGRISVDRNQQRFTYDSHDLLVKVWNTQGVEIIYHYDHLQRMVGRKDSLENSTQFFYAFPDQPYLVR